jgi:hypothetical protein
MATRPTQTFLRRIENLERNLPNAPNVRELTEKRVLYRIWQSSDPTFLAIIQRAVIATEENPTLADDEVALVRVIVAKLRGFTEEALCDALVLEGHRGPAKSGGIGEEDVRKALGLVDRYYLEEYEKILDSVKGGSHGQAARA